MGFNITEIDSLEHDIVFGVNSSLVKIDDTHFILAYAGAADDGFIKTFSIDGSHVITEIDSLEHDVAFGARNSLVKIDDTHFILAYAGDGFVGTIKTFSIDGSYNITEIDSLTHDADIGTNNSLVKIDATYFILAYSNDTFESTIKTFSIDGSYAITEIDFLEHDAAAGNNNSLVKIDDTHFILAYQGADSDGFIKTFSIDGSHVITEIDSLEHDVVFGVDNSLVKIDDTHFILAYAGSGADGFIKIFLIDGSYVITETTSLEHEKVLGTENSLVKIDATHFILAYQGVDSDGFIKTFSIDGSYNITETDSLEHDTVTNQGNSLVKIDDTHFILAYTGSGTNGFIKTFEVEGGAPTLATSDVTNIAETTVDGNGDIVHTGLGDATERGFVYDTTSRAKPEDSGIELDSESFEASLGDWVNDVGNVSDWVRDSGGTSSSGTGPSSGQDGSFYIFIETSSSGSNILGDIDIIEYNIGSIKDGYVDFYYHQYGTDQGKLSLEGYDGSVWAEIWSSEGDQGNEWNHVEQVATDFSGYSKLRFKNLAVGGFVGDVALDLIKVFEIEKAPSPAASDYLNVENETGTFAEGVFSLTLSALDPVATYYVRAYAKSASGDYGYGEEVSFVIAVYGIYGVVTLSGTPVENATVRCIKQSDNTILTQQTTDGSGEYSFADLDPAEKYHLAVEYESGEDLYNALSYWDIVPVEI